MQIASIQTTFSVPAEMLINWLEGLGLGWGLSIIAATFIVRTVVAPFAYRQIRAMSIFRSMGEDAKRIREYHDDDLTGMTGDMEQLYKQNRFNVMSFVVPALLQAPFFASVFFYLNSVAFKQDVGGDRAFLFVDDLTRATSSDTTTFLGLVGAYLGVQILSLLFQSGFRPEKKVLIIGIGLPTIITLFLIHFPAALMLYWTAGMVGLLVQQVLMKLVVGDPEIVHWDEPADAADRAKRRAENPSPKQNPFSKALADAQAARAAEEPKRGAQEGRGVDVTTASTIAADAATVAVRPASRSKKKKKKHGRRR